MWGSSATYGIGMYSGQLHGDLGDYAMTFQMNNDNNRGFVWRDDAMSASQGAMSLSTRGYLCVAERITVGAGISDTSVPATDALEVVGQITATGNITAYSSDARLKNNILNIPNALEKIQSIGGYTFDWDDKVDALGFEPEYRKNDAGLLAQEIQSVLPQAVADAPFDREVDPEDNTKIISKSGEKYLTVRYEKVVPLLVEAIKELKAEVEELKKNSHPCKEMHEFDAYPELIKRIEELEKK